VMLASGNKCRKAGPEVLPDLIRSLKSFLDSCQIVCRWKRCEHRCFTIQGPRPHSSKSKVCATSDLSVFYDEAEKILPHTCFLSS
jgi:hypothetical protein